ncbi:MAG: hypothetical protein N2235_02895 [Fischerella sp.]|nr:hypothetical protein [Fischerella sp.]
MLKNGEINPLNVFDLREVKHLPPHFFVLEIDSNQQVEKNIYQNWIYENLSGRFYIGSTLIKSSEPPYRKIWQKIVAFEISSEASFFALVKDQIKK